MQLCIYSQSPHRLRCLGNVKLTHLISQQQAEIKSEKARKWNDKKSGVDTATAADIT